jgi:Rod binding domain-containing protein
MDISTQFLDVNTLKGNKFKNIDTKNLPDQNLKKVCDDFESFFLKQLMDVSLKTTKIAGEGAGSDIIKSMYTDSLSQASAGNVGISDMLYRFLSEKK